MMFLSLKIPNTAWLEKYRQSVNIDIIFFFSALVDAQKLNLGPGAYNI